MSISLVLRLAAILAVVAALLPLQMLALRLRWPMAARVPVLFHRLVLRLLRVRITTVGRAPEAGRAALLLSNHVSWLDIPILAALAPLSFIAKSEVEGWPLVGLLAKLQRCVFVERSRKASTGEVNAIVAQRLGAGDAMVLFPEGTTGDGIRLLPFRSSLVGAARTALLSHEVETIDLQPVAIAYRRQRGLPLTRREMPTVAWYGDMGLAPHLAAFVRGGPIDVTVVWGEPIAFDRSIDRKAATARAEAIVRQSLETAKRDAAAPQPTLDRPSPVILSPHPPSTAPSGERISVDVTS